eukprot:364785-Chlamydomonas_euryale.AAC.12
MPCASMRLRSASCFSACVDGRATHFSSCIRVQQPTQPTTLTWRGRSAPGASIPSCSVAACEAARSPCRAALRPLRPSPGCPLRAAVWFLGQRSVERSKPSGF